MYNKNIDKGYIMKKVNIILSILTISATLMFAPKYNQEVARVYSACSKDQSSKDCGDIQTKYGMKFLCDELSADAHCWVEVIK